MEYPLVVVLTAIVAQAVANPLVPRYVVDRNIADATNDTYELFIGQASPTGTPGSPTEICPSGLLFTEMQCCSTNVAGAAAVDCSAGVYRSDCGLAPNQTDRFDTVARTPVSPADFQSLYAARGLQAMCCTLPAVSFYSLTLFASDAVLTKLKAGEALACQPPAGAA